MIEVSKDSRGRFNELVADRVSIHITTIEDDTVFIAITSGDDNPITLLIMAPAPLTIGVGGEP
jgi:hypothetical protein